MDPFILKEIPGRSVPLIGCIAETRGSKEV